MDYYSILVYRTTVVLRLSMRREIQAFEDQLLPGISQNIYDTRKMAKQKSKPEKPNYATGFHHYHY